MRLSTISIRRPVLAMVMSIAIIIFGFLGFNFLGVREYPSVDPPIITVSTSYTGANAEIIESQITEPLEESINGIAGIRTITSVSREGRSTITVEFNLEIDLEAAANDVRERVSRAERSLPPDSEKPITSKADADAQPIVFLNVKSDSRNAMELTDIAINLFKERLQTIPGVSEIRIWGSKKPSMRLWMDPVKLASFGLTPRDVRTAIDRENVELPSGRIEGDNTELTVRTLGRLQTAEDFNDLIIKETPDSVVRFRDLGRAELGPENMRTILKRDGEPMVGVVLIPQAGANNIAITDAFYERVESIKKDLPVDIEIGVGFDITNYIRASILEVKQTIIIAFSLVVLVIFFFLRDWRTTVIPVLAIPISLIGAFFVMYIAGFSINVLTLLGIVLAIGLVVDDAIVVLENIYAKIERGMNPIEAGITGTIEIFFAVVATTVALVAVFLPVIFLQGLTGRLFREFGVVVAGSVIISSFVALTLTPMLCSRILKQRKTHNFLYNATEPFFSMLTRVYRKMLTGFMHVRWSAFLIIAACFYLAWDYFQKLPRELAPLEDRASLVMISTGPEGATFGYMDHYLDRLIYGIQQRVPETDAIISVTSPGFGASSSVNSGFVRVILNQADERERSQQEIADVLNGFVRGETGARTFVSQPQTIGGRRVRLPVQFVIQAPDLTRLKEVLPKFLEKARAHPTFQVVSEDLKFNKPVLRVDIDRARARDMGVSVLDVAQTLQLAYSGQRFGYFIRNSKQYQVIGQMESEDRDTPTDLTSLYVRGANGELVQMDNLLAVREESRPPTLYRTDRYVSATVSAGLAKGKTLDEGIQAMEAIAAELLDDRFSTALAGPSRDFVESSSSLTFAFGLALVLIYLVLAAQFESFRDPFIILFTVPMALTGTLLSLWYFGQSLNVFSQIGIIMLIGLVTKNGILIVEFANQRKKTKGLSLTEAVQEAAVARFRPILMTSTSTILGIMPIALALGAGAESRVSMGIAVIGGLVFSGALTLFIIPAIYTFFSAEHAVEREREVNRVIDKLAQGETALEL
ncbi:MAG: efflux RND transporter permease subunit [Acidobacteriota bacterium]|nr:efflux RND transporter permease subunit [Acidobacteriota bacterium]